MSSYNRQKTRALHTNSPQWRAIRKMVLDREPLCRYCAKQGRLVVATEVDHVNNDTFDNSLDALQPLCKSCHSSKTAQEQRGGVATIKGHDINGNPLDPNHPWCRERSPAG
jgi:5-methylcytosine-specific restriction endonuclease McrA